MRLLFVHKHFPGQFRHLARAFAAQHDTEVVALVEGGESPVPGVRTVAIQATRASGPPTHHYVQTFETAVLLGQAAFRACMSLQAEGFVPDLIYAHAGFGPGYI